MVAPGKNILAMDESDRTCNKGFEKLGTPRTQERRRAYRELILTLNSAASSGKYTPEMEKFPVLV